MSCTLRRPTSTDICGDFLITKILVFGGFGYTGSYMVKHLERSGFVSVVPDDLTGGYRNAVAGAEFVLGDAALMADLFDGNCFDAVKHCDLTTEKWSSLPLSNMLTRSQEIAEKQVRAQYTYEFKLEAVRQVREGQPISVVSKILCIPKANMSNLVRLAGKGDITGAADKALTVTWVMGLVKLFTVAIDGKKFKANASCKWNLSRQKRSCNCLRTCDWPMSQSER